MKKAKQLNLERKVGMMNRLTQLGKKAVAVTAFVAGIIAGGGCGNNTSDNYNWSKKDAYSYDTRKKDNRKGGKDINNKNDINQATSDACKRCDSNSDCDYEQLCLEWKNFPGISWCADECYNNGDCPEGFSCDDSGSCKPFPPGKSEFDSMCDGSYELKIDSCGNVLEENYCDEGCSAGSCILSTGGLQIIDNIPDEIQGSDLAAWYKNSSTQQCKLNTTKMSWRMNNFTGDIPGSVEIQENTFRAACETWAEFLTIDCEKMLFGNPRVEASFYPPAPDPCGNNPLVIACANYPCTSDQFIAYNDKKMFTDDFDEAKKNHNIIDLQSVTLHEFGHILGLPHTDDPHAVMYKYYKPQRNLTSTDIDMLKQLYGK